MNDGSNGSKTDDGASSYSTDLSEASSSSSSFSEDLSSESVISRPPSNYSFTEPKDLPNGSNASLSGVVSLQSIINGISFSASMSKYSIALQIFEFARQHLGIRSQFASAVPTSHPLSNAKINLKSATGKVSAGIRRLGGRINRNRIPLKQAILNEIIVENSDRRSIAAAARARRASLLRGKRIRTSLRNLLNSFWSGGGWEADESGYDPLKHLYEQLREIYSTEELQHLENIQRDIVADYCRRQ